MNKQEAISLVSGLTGVPARLLTAGYLPGDGVYHVSEPIRGGISVIVGQDESVLFAASSVDFDDHLDHFNKGIRTEYSRFARLREQKTAWYAAKEKKSQE